MYITVEDVRQIMRSLPTVGKLPDEDIWYFIEIAQSHVDSFLSDAYETPFLSPPKLIRKTTLDLAVYFLTESLYTSFQPNQQEGNQVRYDRSMEVLKSVRNGDIKLAGVEPNKPFDMVGYASTFEGDLFFSLNKEEEW